MAACTCNILSSELLFKSFESPSQSKKRNFAGSKAWKFKRASLNVDGHQQESTSLLTSASAQGLKIASHFYRRSAPADTTLRSYRPRGIQKRVGVIYGYAPLQVLAFVQNSNEWDETKLERDTDKVLNCTVCCDKQVHGSSDVPAFRRNLLVENDRDKNFEEEQLIGYGGKLGVGVEVRTVVSDHFDNDSKFNTFENNWNENQPLDGPTLRSFQSMGGKGDYDHTESCLTQLLDDKFSNLTHKVDVNLKPGSKRANYPVRLPGSRRVVELLTAWDGLAGRLSPEPLRSKDSQLLIAALKLAIIALKDVSFSGDQRLPLARALAVAYLLADLQMDAEVIAAGLLREVVEAGMIGMGVVQSHLGSGVMHLLHDCIRVKRMPSRVQSLDEESASLLRKFSLAFHDIRAVIVEVIARVDAMRHVHTVPKYQQHILALEAMQIYAPLAHALGIGNIPLELEDISFRVLFPDSYAFVESWLRTNWKEGDGVISRCQQILLEALRNDIELQELVESVEVLGRIKSRFSTMKKLLKDGRSIEEVYDILGLRVILVPRSGAGALEEREKGMKACYRASKIVTNLWEEVPGRMKDYIANPKKNGYESLHLAVYLSNHEWRSFPVELQIRTAAMDALAVEGTASHAFYKGGLTDPNQVRQLKEIMMAAASAAASRFQGSPCDGSITERELQIEEHDHLFKLFDKNEDGFISMEEFRAVIGELGAERDDAQELMQLVDSNTDGYVSAKEFGDFLFQLRSSEDLAALRKPPGNQLVQKWHSNRKESEPTKCCLDGSMCTHLHILEDASTALTTVAT
ncbi:hypothetical protein O6H91_05G023600 [Diphasiastrum complanatum]|uniref:Uncharacterized protein n=1 Tax=Diphasiastrum complanatum TaxID=34168 RepID=A0ACC2DLF4_DIPCM|nr:hypothetical protein O6H91_05G023600 [Diphasiastrum complanatum]